ncbi:MAG: Jag N-terminal domain-containing protein [Elusimicrobiaceae bacterium]|nr:Jag N-terminal domain-containing protein [Elusimicrobiaceae bacterium]
MLSKVKVQGKTVAEAIAKGLKELHLRRDQVDVKVLEQPKKGFLGFGSKPAVVEVHKKRWNSSNLDAEIYMDVPKHRRGGRKGGRRNARRSNKRSESREMREPRQPRVHTPKANEPQLLPSEAIQNAVIPEKLQAPMSQAKEYIINVLTHMGVKPENVNVWWDEKQQRILVTFDCDKPAIVIGKEGKTLEAIEYLSTLAVTRQFDMPISVVADTQNYWRKAEDKILVDIERGVDMIKNGASVFRFRPMSSQLRRYIHRAVEGNEYVQTASEGEGKWRKVTFRPTQKALDEAKAGTAPADFVPGVIGEDIPQESAQTDAQTETTTDETPTQKMATQTVAQTVSHTVIETDGHVVEEHSVVVTTESAQPESETSETK